MGAPFASGDWRVVAGKEDEFVERWAEFLAWTRQAHPGLVSASLLRDDQDPQHFISFADWEDAEARDAWRQSEEFVRHFTACRELCTEMRGADYERVSAV